MIVTDGNGNRVTGVIYADGVSVLRIVNGLRWNYLANDGGLTESTSIIYLGMTCTGTKYWSAPANGPSLQLTTFDLAGNAYRYIPTGALVLPAADDSYVVETDGGSGPCYGPERWGNRGEPGEGVWPLEAVTKPADLVGPLTVAAQN